MLKEKTKLLVRECLPPIMLRLVRSFRSLITKNSYPLKGEEQSAAFYDRSFLDHDHWHRHYTESRYFPMWAIIADRIVRSQVSSILDIGCGPGQVAQLLRDKGVQSYLGIDFSTERVMQARAVCPEFDFLAVDVFETDLLATHNYAGVVCLEFLEHVERDLQVIQNLHPGTLFWASVPNFGGKQHVRHFRSSEEVIQRYADYFDDFRTDEHIANNRGTKYFLLEGIVKSRAEVVTLS
jgi:trans-aconitate methyltransferase